MSDKTREPRPVDRDRLQFLSDQMLLDARGIFKKESVDWREILVQDVTHAIKSRDLELARLAASNERLQRIIDILEQKLGVPHT